LACWDSPLLRGKWEGELNGSKEVERKSKKVVVEHPSRKALFAEFPWNGIDAKFIGRPSGIFYGVVPECGVER